MCMHTAKSDTETGRNDPRLDRDTVSVGSLRGATHGQ